MNSSLFYEQSSGRTTPVHLLSQAQWLESEALWTATERNYFAAQQFKGGLGDCCLIYNAEGSIEKIYVGSGAGVQEAAVAQAALLVPAGSYHFIEPLTQTAAVVWALAQYRYVDYKKQEILPRKLLLTQQDVPAINALVDAVFLVRDLINKPANDLGPQQIAEVAQYLADSYQAQLEQWVGDDLTEANFPAIHAVGRASISAPRLVSLTWGQAHHPRVTVVGKGVSFDSGGLDIKPSSAMRWMKKDMGGAAHALGLAQWIMKSALPVRLQVLIPTVENAIGPNAFRPGDVLRMRNGLTVEIDNTDAEGRLILADALTKACEEQPDLLIDFATLTGAARTAVGTEIAAMFCNDDALAAHITNSSAAVADPVWRMPLFAAYEEQLYSSIADLANSSSSPYAGAIVAALFLQHFITPSTPWLHFDVMAWNVSNKPGKPEGGEAMGLRAVAEYLLRRYGT